MSESGSSGASGPSRRAGPRGLGESIGEAGEVLRREPRAARKCGQGVAPLGMAAGDPPGGGVRRSVEVGRVEQDERPRGRGPRPPSGRVRSGPRSDQRVEGFRARRGSPRGRRSRSRHRSSECRRPSRPVPRPPEQAGDGCRVADPAQSLRGGPTGWGEVIQLEDLDQPGATPLDRARGPPRGSRPAGPMASGSPRPRRIRTARASGVDPAGEAQTALRRASVDRPSLDHLRERPGWPPRPSGPARRWPGDGLRVECRPGRRPARRASARPRPASRPRGSSTFGASLRRTR